MPLRADAHIHLFESGYGHSFAARPGVAINEPTCYDSLRREHGIEQALVVGYEMDPWCQQNNQFLSEVAACCPWARPVASVDPKQPLSLQELDQLAAAGFVGLSFYIFEPEHRRDLAAIDDAFWTWLIQRHWLVSANGRGENWSTWRNVLDRHPQLRLLISHLGLPPAVAQPPDTREALTAMAEVIALAPYPKAHVKLSGFYALSEPGYDYPHKATWPYVQLLVDHFGAPRLLWASDFTPHLDCVSFPQTIGLLAKMPFFSETDLAMIEGKNLLQLLEKIH